MEEHFVSERSKALLWWHTLGTIMQAVLCKQHYPDRLLHSLTGREIQEIYKKRV